MNDHAVIKKIRTRRYLAIAGMAILVLLSGCAAMEAQKRLKEYEGIFEPMVGKARPSDVVMRFGEPVRKDRIGSTELWYYHIPYKDPKGAQGSKGLEGGYAVGSESELFDDLTVEFDSKGYLKSWRGYIQR
jgi:outer membrane protein assembly factor BamE (lipoprotein component of BamABCDE complex)